MSECRQPLHTPLMKVQTSPISVAVRRVSRDEDRSDRHEGQRGEASPRRHPQTQESDTCAKIQKICQHRRPHPLKQELRHGRGLVSTPTCPPTTAANTCGPAWLSADASRKSEMSCSFLTMRRRPETTVKREFSSESSRSRRKISISFSRPKKFILLNPHLLYLD